MKLTFLGANRQVTGSSYLLEAGGLRLMIDHGLFQEREFLWRNWEACPLSPNQIDLLLLTHAHLDHIGLLPRLVRDGLGGPIITTAPSVDLAGIVLHDSARLQEEDAAYKRKRHAREKRCDVRPAAALYTPQDVERTMPLMRAVRYRQPVELGPGVTATFHDAGHILGSSMIEVRAEGKRVLFSGDIGQRDKPFIEDPSVFEGADVLVMESTYGDRDHAAAGDPESAMAQVINRAVPRGGSVLIPTFAIERAQEMVYYISRLMRGGQIPSVPVFLDSPMAVDVSDIFVKYRDWLDEPAQKMLSEGKALLDFPQLSRTRTAEQSKAINGVRPAIILAGNGMCTGGRIKHHLTQNISDPRATVLFVGFQGQGTLGRQILDGNKTVRIFGRHWPVNARVERLEGLSAHADRTGLMRWLSFFKSAPSQLFLTHGEEPAAMALAEQIGRTRGWSVTVPEYLQTLEIG